MNLVFALKSTNTMPVINKKYNTSINGLIYIELNQAGLKIIFEIDSDILKTIANSSWRLETAVGTL